MTLDPDQLVTLTTAPTDFAARVAAAVLQDAGIEAFVFGSAGTAVGLTVSAQPSIGRDGEPIWGVPVQVRRQDLEQARATLLANRADSVDIDWDQVDLGRREDTLPLVTNRNVPLPAKVGMWLGIVLVLCGLLFALILVVTST